jgi:hypothetical protein
MTGYDALAGFSADEGSNSACRWGAFSVSKSSTAQTAEQLFVDFVVAYTDTINVSGVNITDTLMLGDIELQDFSMGLVSSTSNQQWIGMLGLGNDATTNFPRPSAKYRPNFVDRLVSSGKITSQAYSIWLDNAEGTSGALLLGAIDTSRYEGELMRLNAAQPYDVFPSAFRISLVSVNIDDDGRFQYTGPSILASLSPAETFSYLPDGLAEGIMAASGASWNTALQRATIPCDAGSKTPQTSLRFQLEGQDGPVLNARLADLVVPQEVSDWEIAYATLGTLNKTTCLFGIQKYGDLRASNTPQYNLGSSLLRRTYMVFDAANKHVALAPAKQVGSSSDQSSIVPFEERGAPIPQSRFYCAGGDGDSCIDATQSNGDSSGSGPSDGASSPNENWKKIVIGVVVPIGILAVLVPVVYVIVMRRKRQAEAKQREKELGTDGEESFKEDAFGVTVTVSVSSKVSVVKPPSPPALFLGLPGALPSFASESRRNSQHSGNGSLAGPGSESGRSGSGSEIRESGSGGRKEVWEPRT